VNRHCVAALCRCAPLSCASGAAVQLVCLRVLKVLPICVFPGIVAGLAHFS